MAVLKTSAFASESNEVQPYKRVCVNTLTTKSQWLKIIFWNFTGLQDLTYC